MEHNINWIMVMSWDLTDDVLICSSGHLVHSAWITRRTASEKMGKSFVLYQEASITAGSPESTGRTDCSRCTWQDWMPSRRTFTCCLALIMLHSHLFFSCLGCCWECVMFQLTSISKLIQEKGFNLGCMIYRVMTIIAICNIHIAWTCDLKHFNFFIWGNTYTTCCSVEIFGNKLQGINLHQLWSIHSFKWFPKNGIQSYWHHSSQCFIEKQISVQIGQMFYPSL